MTRPLASLSLDLDNAWAYLKTHGDPAWEARPSYLDVAVPRALEVLDEAGLRLTFFVVGEDAAAPAHVELLASMVEAGHEVGNHSWSHEPWFHLFDDDRIAEELDRTSDAIAAATGERPVGFRGPGYSLSAPLLRMLAARGYRYDASTLPTWIGPLARAYYFRSAKLPADERAKRSQLFGNARDGLRPLQPYRWDLGEQTMLELPVTTLPLVRVPMHVSYVLYLEALSPRLARAYFRAALATCRATKVEPSILLHPLDLLGGDDLPGSGLEFFPGMEVPGERKRRLLVDCLRLLAAHHDVVPMREHVDAVERRDLPRREPAFHTPAPA